MIAPNAQERLTQIVEPLLFWYQKNKRSLPWRDQPTPYRVWVSEIMLQQTRAEAVKPYFERFLSQLPSIQALASCPEDRLLKLWEGLGYYSRARNLQKAARLLVEQYGGQLPADYRQLTALPGIGDYTAGAIASIAFGIAVPAVDGNVLRVISRILCCGDDIGLPQTKQSFRQLLLPVVPQHSAGDFNQALMEGIATSFGCLLALLPDPVPVLTLAFFFLFFSCIVRISPHFYRTIVTYLCSFAALCFSNVSLSVRLGFLLITAGVFLRMHLSQESKERCTIKLLWMR